MAQGRTFGQVVDDVALELGRNITPSATKGWRDQMKVYVRRAYEELLDEYDWPQLRSVFSKTLAAGERFYDFPELAQFGKFYAPHVNYGGSMVPLSKGVSLRDYGIYDPETMRADPPMKWDVKIGPEGAAQVEIWPTPASDGTKVWFTGQYGVPDLVSDDTVLLLDDVLVRLWVLMERAEAEGRKNFKTIQAKAQRRLQLQKAKFEPDDGFSLAGKAQWSRRAPPNDIRVVRGTS
jgi:hypothetical protein